jgi:hypothetical protein
LSWRKVQVVLYNDKVHLFGVQYITKLTPSVGWFCFETFKKEAFIICHLHYGEHCRKPKATGGGANIGRKWRPGFKTILLTPMGVIAALHRKFGKACSVQVYVILGLLTHADGGQCSRIKHT